MQNMRNPNRPLSKDDLWDEIRKLSSTSQSAQDCSSADFQDFVEDSLITETENLKSCEPEETAEDNLPAVVVPVAAEPQVAAETLPWSKAVETCVQLGFPVIPVNPQTGEPAVAADEWKAGYSQTAAREHFVRHTEHKPALVLPDDIIAFQTQEGAARKELWKVLQDGGTAPFLRLQTGESEICVFQWMKEGRLVSSLPVHKDIDGQIGITYPGYSLYGLNQEMVIAACDVESLSGLHVIDAVQMAEIHRFNRKVVTAALSEDENAERHPLGRHSLRGQSAKIKSEMVAAVDVLPGMALRGQSTMIFAPPNTGKTLIVIYMIIQAIKAGLLEPSHLFYVNVDDNTEGLYHKLLLAEKHGFHMLAEGYEGYRAQNFLDQIAAVIKDGVAARTVVILDTLKRFTDVMDKRKNSEFTGLMRQFVLKGGTVIALGHTNKKRSASGKSVFAGTSDLTDDVDCAYILDEVESDRADQRKIVEFRREKGRGRVVEKAVFSYSVADGLTYPELLASVEEMDPASLESIYHAATMQSDKPVIDAIEQSIRDGQNAKMQLITGVARQAKVGQRTVGSILERYTGEDPGQHRWTYHVGERGAKLYVLIASDPSTPTEQ